MLIDAESLEAQTQKAGYDVCIVGAGAAGITLALELARQGGVRVCLLESGDFEFDAQTQALYKGEVVGHPYYDLDILRLRFFGGTTNHWAGACRPLDPVDFERRDGVPESGWPFGSEELNPYYARAHQIVGLGPFD